MDDTPNSLVGSNESQNGAHWTFSQSRVQKSFVVFIAQMLILLTVIIFCLVNISKDIQTDFSRNLLCFSIASILPAPKIKKAKA